MGISGRLRKLYTNLAQTYASVCASATNGVDWAVVQEALGTSVQPHPVDTHPPLTQRLQNLGLTLASIPTDELLAPENPASVLVPEVNAIEEALSTLEAQWLVAIGAVVLPETPAAAPA